MIAFFMTTRVHILTILENIVVYTTIFWGSK